MEEIDNLAMKNEIMNWEERNMITKFKFGIVYCKSGQVKEEEMFNNKEGSEQFETFLDCFADKINTLGWNKFAGGLNMKAELDGVYSRYACFQGFEIMFHVSTYLKYSLNDQQQLERKRHIGNDVVVIVFMEGDQPLDPSFIRTQFNHVYIVVKAVPNNNGKTGYKIGVAAKHGVVPFGPYVQDRVYNAEEMRVFLLTKLVNAERAALHASAFRDRIMRARQLFLAGLLANYSKNK